MKKILGVLFLLLFWPNLSLACVCSGGNCQNGTGYLQYPADNATYHGELLNCKKHGKGVYTYGRGDIYVGEFKDDYVEGQGVHLYDNEDFYVGGFKKDNPYGKGIYTQANGNIWEIEFNEYSEAIHQKKIVSNDERYNEKFLTLVDGKPTYVWPNGDKYTGDVLNGKRHGKGIFMYAYGDSYEGEFKDDKFHNGTYIWANMFYGMDKTEHKYTGQWNNGKFHGLGTYYRTHGKNDVGKWENNKFIGIVLSSSDQKTFDQLKIKISEASNLAKLCVMVQKSLQNFYLARVSDANKYIKDKNLNGMRKSIRDFKEISMMGFTASGNTDQYCKAGIN